MILKPTFLLIASIAVFSSCQSNENYGNEVLLNQCDSLKATIATLEDTIKKRDHDLLMSYAILQVQTKTLNKCTGLLDGHADILVQKNRQIDQCAESMNEIIRDCCNK